jgi:hypothetical protein
VWCKLVDWSEEVDVDWRATSNLTFDIRLNVLNLVPAIIARFHLEKLNQTLFIKNQHRFINRLLIIRSKIDPRTIFVINQLMKMFRSSPVELRVVRSLILEANESHVMNFSIAVNIIILFNVFESLFDWFYVKGELQAMNLLLHNVCRKSPGHILIFLISSST